MKKSKFFLAVLISMCSIFTQAQETRQVFTSVPDQVHLMQNPFKPMNILLIPSNTEGVTASAGDLVLAFDDTICVGAALVEDADKILNLVATSTDSESKGFRDGNKIRLEYHSVAQQLVYDLETVKVHMGSMEYQALETVYADFKAITVDISENNISTTVDIYPNPAKHTLHIVLNEIDISGIDELQINIHSFTGKSVFSKNYSSGQKLINIDMEPYPSGEYVLSVSTGKEKITKKIIKN